MLPVRQLARTSLGSLFLRQWRFGLTRGARLLSSSLSAQEAQLNEIVTKSESSVTESAKNTSENYTNEQRNGKNGQKNVNGDSGSSNRKNPGAKRYKINPKLRDISSQVRSSIELANGSDTAEALEILEEGLSYLREVQVAEGINEESLFSVFQPVLDVYSQKITDASTLNKVLDLAIEHKVAHGFLFSKVMALQALESYQAALQTWVRFLEYSSAVNNGLVFKRFGFMKDSAFRKRDLTNLAFYLYVQSCLALNAKYDFRDAMKLLQTDEVPEIFHVRRTVMGLGAVRLEKEFQEFQTQLNAMELESLDPNGSVVIRKINRAIATNDFNLLNRTYDLVQDAALKYKRPISENTLTRFMNGYFECLQIDRVFDIFRSMLQNGISKPSIVSWDIVLRCMGHPSYLRTLNETKRKEISVNLRRTIDTVLSLYPEMSPKTLSIIVAGFANMNDFEAVDEFLTKYSVQGKGKVPVIHATKNNILIGLVLNKKVDEAEKKLKELMEDGSGYVPSTLCMNTFLNHYARADNYKAVDGILKFMKQHNIAEEIGTYTIVIDLYFKMHRAKGLAPNVTELLESFANNKQAGLTLNDYTYSILISGLVKDGLNLEAARTLFEHSKSYGNSPHVLTAMLEGELDHGSVGNAEILFEKYTKSKNEPRVWNQMIKALLYKHELLALHYYHNFKNQEKISSRCNPNHYTYYFLIQHFIKKGNKEKIEWMLKEMAENGTELGTELPKIIRRLSKEYTVPKPLLDKIAV